MLREHKEEGKGGVQGGHETRVQAPHHKGERMTKEVEGLLHGLYIDLSENIALMVSGMNNTLTEMIKRILVPVN